MRIIGIDPGLATTGFGIIDFLNQKMTLIDYGIISTPAGLHLPERLDMLYESMTKLIEGFYPTTIAFEELFFAKNVKTAIDVAQARGALVAAAYSKVKDLYEYTPLQVKQAVVGYGRAEKQQVQMMIKTLLCLKDSPRPDDAADACAIAICHAQNIGYNSTLKIERG